MPTLRCPKCDSTFAAGDGWAKTAVTLLVAAPAVPDMATQVRCPNCRHLFAEGDIRYLASSWPKGVKTWLTLAGIALAAWVVYRFLVA